jgi:UDP-glucose 4-epimerase
MVDGVVRCVENEKANNEVFNIGSTREISIADLAKKVWTLVRPTEEPRIEFKPYAAFGRYEDVMRRIPDITKARTVLGFEPQMDLDTGLRTTIAWQIERRRQLGMPVPEPV